MTDDDTQYEHSVESPEDSVPRRLSEPVFYWGGVALAVVSLVTSGQSALDKFPEREAIRFAISAPGLILALLAVAATCATTWVARGTLGYVRLPALLSVLALAGAMSPQVAATAGGGLALWGLAYLVYKYYFD